MRHVKQSQQLIRDLIKRDIANNTNFQSIFPGTCPMQEITQYTLTSGKRLRPMIVLSLSNNIAEHFALFIEYIHNSSLVVDDLPCMDDDSERRGAPSVHAKYGGHVAILVSYNLMITAMKHLADGFRHIQALNIYSKQEYDYLYHKINKEMSDNLGYTGICGGQMLDIMICTDEDIQNKNPREQRELIMKIIKLKTGCLFSLSFVLGWIVQYRDLNKLDDIREAGYSFGVCYQIIDDLRDLEKDTKRSGGRNNICKYFTRNEIIDIFTDNIQQFAETITGHQLWNPTLKELYNYMLLSFKKEIQT